MVYITNSITLKSWSGTYSNTVISGNYPTWTTRVVYVTNTGAVLDGLTISNGWSTSDSGVGAYFYGKLVTNCLITHNYTTNSASYIHPAGINMAAGTISHSVIRNNKLLGTKQAYGWGIELGASVVVSNCVVSNNVPVSCGGGGIRIAANSTLVNSDISNEGGSGVIIDGNNWQIISCTISNNAVNGIEFRTGGTNRVIKNCLIKKNGYGIATDEVNHLNHKTRIENCTITRNTLDGVRASTFGQYATNLIVVNSIIYYNARYNWSSASGTNAVYSNSCTFPMPTNIPGLPEGTGNITNAPMFVDTNTNFRLSRGSPCVNRGVNQDWMNYAVDLDGRKRIMERVVDMGVYELLPPQGTIFCVH